VNDASTKVEAPGRKPGPDERTGPGWRLARACDPQSAWSAAAWYVAATIAMTWPLVLGLTRDLPGDIGDPLFNCWVLGWGARHLERFLTGHLDAFRGFWNANIFYPAPLALAYSEHLFAQVVQILPVYALTGNLLLCYNLLFLSTYVLSGVGTYLLVRDLTGSPRAAFVAGLLYGFAPYRVPQIPHLQVLSSQWMPFVLFGLRRYFQSRRSWALAGAMVALLAQNLSCGYYALFFAPFVAVYVLYEIVRRRLVRDLRLWGTLVVAAGLVLLANWPFIQAYRAVRAQGFERRSVIEISRFSADVLSYATAGQALWLWGGRVNAMPRGEGELFPGVVPVVLASAALVWLGLDAWQLARKGRRKMALWRRLIAVAAVIVLLAETLAVAFMLARHHLDVDVGLLTIRAKNIAWPVEIALVDLLVLVAVSPMARAVLKESVRGPAAFFLAAVGAAFVLSFGPEIRTGGLPLAAGPYLLLQKWVPGTDGLRVPSRFAMLVALFLAILGGYGAARLERRLGRRGVVVLAAGALFLVEATAVPIALNVGLETPGLLPPVRFVRVGPNVAPVYRYLARLPANAVVVEFPFGEDTYETQYMFYSTYHWRPLLNGYSGGAPSTYVHLADLLRRPELAPERAWQALIDAGATHAVVHETAYLPEGEKGKEVIDWLLRHHAVEINMLRTDRVFALPR
jgi:hypothetical protein